jgi:hypothetical protein
VKVSIARAPASFNAVISWIAAEGAATSIIIPADFEAAR